MFGAPSAPKITRVCSLSSLIQDQPEIPLDEVQLDDEYPLVSSWPWLENPTEFNGGFQLGKSLISGPFSSHV